MQYASLPGENALQTYSFTQMHLIGIIEDESSALKMYDSPPNRKIMQNDLRGLFNTLFFALLRLFLHSFG